MFSVKASFEGEVFPFGSAVLGAAVDGECTSSVVSRNGFVEMGRRDMLGGGLGGPEGRFLKGLFDANVVGDVEEFWRSRGERRHQQMRAQ